MRLPYELLGRISFGFTFESSLTHEDAAVLALPREIDDTNTNKLHSHVPWHPHDLGDRFSDARCHASALGATREKASAAALLRLDTLGHNALFLRPLFTSIVAV